MSTVVVYTRADFVRSVSFSVCLCCLECVQNDCAKKSRVKVGIYAILIPLSTNKAEESSPKVGYSLYPRPPFTLL
jgi:hypothetical protein